MSQQAIKINGRPFALGKRIGKGGEGEVFAVETKPDSAVKIYKDELRAKREPKVRAMVLADLADTTKLVAFPAAIATDGKGGFLGFLMRLVTGYRPIHELYGPKSRKAHFPKADYRFLVRAALNVSNAVVKVHQSGCVIGDFNHSGVLVSNEATVSLIDADSFQYSRDGKLFPCVVGVPDFTPPELHGADLSTVRRTEAHDNFGLAVAIFHLLAMGKHPYAGRFAGGDISMSDAIAQHRFAFSQVRASETCTTPPPGSVSLKDFPPQIAAAFEAAFGRNPAGRPSAVTWATLMKELEQALSHCGKVRTHYYPSAASSCLWCRVAGQSGVDMFPDLLGPTPQIAPGGPFDIERIAAQFAAIKLPDPASLLPIWSGQITTASEAVAAASRARMGHRALGAVALIAAVGGFLAAANFAIVWIGIGLFGLIRFFGGSVEQAPFKAAYSDADARVRSLQQRFVDRLGLSELVTVKADVEASIQAYRDLDRDLAHNIQKLKASREARKREEYLDRFLIRRARIAGIGAAKTATLGSYGIETAADIKSNAVRAVPGFGEAMTAKLLAWRKAHEDRFTYNSAPDASDVQAENAVRANWATKRADLQTKIRSALAALQTGPQQVAIRARNGDPALTDALAKRAQAAHDLKSLGMSVPTAAPFTIQSRQAASPAPSPNTPPRSPSSGRAAAPSCPQCGSSMQRRTARRGHRAGAQFWGCSRYPTCRGTRN
ncbi:topoisomerase DNA-binding C4 zinc finger domain-containing protein [Sphingobium limneticum]|uniref:helix-hairpin-helix domain-containing protein n=1 Tax=Sphingobium limneticum TaxID=1007511 RepID=UPI003D047A87